MASGLGVSLVMLATSSALTFLSALQLVRCSASLRARTSPITTSPAPVPTWAPLLESACGARSGAIVDLILAVFGFGVVVLYFSFIGDFLASLFSSVVAGSHARWPFICGSLVVTIAMGFPNDLGALRYASVFIIGVLVILSLTSWAALAWCSGLKAEPVVWIESSPKGALQSFCTFIFTQMIHLNLFTVFESLSPPHAWSPRSLHPRATADSDRMQNIILFAVMTNMLINLNLALPGYLLWRSNTKQDYILNFTEDACPVWIIYAIRAVEVLLALITACGIPINLVPSRQGLVRLIRRCMPADSPDPFEGITLRLLLTVVICTALCCIAIAAGGAVNDIINILGGTLSTLLMFVLPALFYWKSGLDADRPKLRLLSYFGFMLGTLAGFGGMMLTVIGKFTG
eukprot:CAMPEP_0172717636 /NCGR_PEP_ID=MMETSP1074-20121228/72003_1 /TAXON_ID=2916 /ORGANISM="Ceratium fusus, Strain PA161109" /LENGTH=401 /DNA_ID=CAMNT_0013542617 /DNA_START=310 /DNA_END=1515 /DNA_ORIENTATION=+